MMANWQRTLNLLPEWKMRIDDEISLQDLSRVVAERLSAVKQLGISDLDEQRDDLVHQFKEMSNDTSLTVDEFDEVLNELYDWGDTHIDGSILAGKKACWIKTF